MVYRFYCMALLHSPTQRHLINRPYKTSPCAEDMDMLWIKSRFVSNFCPANLSCFMIVHIYKDKHKVAGDIRSLS